MYISVIAICRYRGRVGTGLSVLWVAYWRTTYHSKHVEQFPDKLRDMASCWIYIRILLRCADPWTLNLLWYSPKHSTYVKICREHSRRHFYFEMLYLFFRAARYLGIYNCRPVAHFCDVTPASNLKMEAVISSKSQITTYKSIWSNKHTESKLNATTVHLYTNVRPHLIFEQNISSHL